MKAPGPIVFFGTPDFAVPTLDALAEAGLSPSLVVTQPSRPVGRGRRVELPPVGKWAEFRGVELAQPQSVRDAAFLERLRGLRPWVALVVAFGQIFRRKLLELPEEGCINLHASLLPKYRGAAPIQAALAAGEAVTGVTTLRMGRGLDSGPMLLKRETRIRHGETAGELSERLAVLGGELVVETLGALAEDGLVAEEQDEAEATYAPKIEKSHGRVEWNRDASSLANLYSAVTPWPGLTASLGGEPVKLLDVVAADWEVTDDESAVPAPAGTFLGLSEAGAVVACSSGQVAAGRLQRPGRRALSAREFVNGERLAPGDRFDVAESSDSPRDS